MSEEIKITLKNIPKKFIDNVWKDAIKEGKKTLGFVIKPSNEIEIDFSLILETDLEIASALVTAIVSAHAIQYFNNTYNPIPE